MRRRTPLLASLAIAVALSAAGPAAAQQPDPAQEAKRTQLFLEGRKLADEGRWADAVEKMREVIAIRSAPKALIALAVVERELTHYLEARALLRQAASDAKAQSLPEDVEAAEAALASLGELFARVDLEGGHVYEGLQVFVDDQPAVIEGTAVLLDPGRHVMRLEAPGKRPQRAEISLSARQRVPLTVKLRGEDEPDPDAPPPPDDGFDLLDLPLGPMILGGAGALTLGVGFVFMGVGSGQQSDAEALCGGRNTNCPESARDPAESGATQIVVGDVLFGVGTAALIGGGVWMFLELTGDDAKPSAARATPGGFAVSF